MATTPQITTTTSTTLTRWGWLFGHGCGRIAGVNLQQVEGGDALARRLLPQLLLRLGWRRWLSLFGCWATASHTRILLCCCCLHRRWT
jgi:hypothetical protein